MKPHEYITVQSRRGHFNFCDPSQESVSTHVAVMTPDGLKKMSCNITTTPYEVDDNDVQTVVSWIRYHLKRLIYSTDSDNIESVLDYIIKNEDDLYLGDLQHKLKIATGKRNDLNKTIEDLEKRLSGHGHFEKGAWVEP